MVREGTPKFNNDKEPHEEERKDERKNRREKDTQPLTLDWKCKDPGCIFVMQTMAGQVKDVRQGHDSMVMLMERCALCDKALQKQRITMHSRDG